MKTFVCHFEDGQTRTVDDIRENVTKKDVLDVVESMNRCMEIIPREVRPLGLLIVRVEWVGDEW